MASREGAARSRMRDDAGAQMVEFALVLPVLLLMVLGILNAGHLFGQKLALNQAVREGARMAAVPGTNNGASVDSVGEIQALVRTNTGGLVDATRVNVTLSASTGCRNLTVGQQLRVTAAYDAPPLVPMPIPGFPASFGLTGTAVYRCEWGQ